MGTADDQTPGQAAAYKALRKWAQVQAQRDEVIRAAVAAGIDHRSIQEITGVARTTITRIMARRPDPAPPTRP